MTLDASPVPTNNATPEEAPTWLPVGEAAKRLGVSRQRIHQRIKAGSLRAERVQSVTAARFHYMLPADQFVDSPAYAEQGA